MDNREFQAYTQKVNQLVDRVSALPDETARSTALELLQSIMDLQGAVMSRMIELLSEHGQAGTTSLAKLGSDPLICGQLVLYGIHPVSMADRVTRAIEKLRPQLHKQGASVDVLGVSEGSVRVKIQTGGNGHGSSEKLKDAVQQAILEAAPEVVQIVTEGVTSPGFIPVNMIQQASKEENSYEKSPA